MADAWAAFAMRHDPGGDNADDDDMLDGASLPTPSVDQTSASAPSELEDVDVDHFVGNPVLHAVVAWQPLEAKRPWDVSAAEAEALQQKPCGYAVVPLRRSLDCVESLAADPNTRLDADVQTIGDHYLSVDRNHRIRTKATISDSLGVDRWKLEAKLGRLANSLLHCDRAGLQVLGEAIRADAAELCLFIEVSRYDATKLTTTTEESVKDLVGQVSRAAMKGCIDEADVIELATAGSIVTLPIVVGKTSSPSYLLGSDHYWACLVRVPDGDQDRYITFFGSVLAWFQLIDRSTAETCKRALSEISATFLDAHHYKLKVRASCTDSASSNFRTEASIAMDRDGDWVNIPLPCLIHKASTAHTKTLDLVAFDISAMIHFAFSVSTSAAMSKFRTAASAVICERLEIKRGAPPQSAKDYQDHMIGLFLSRGRHYKLRGRLLKRTLNSNWEDHSTLTA